MSQLSRLDFATVNPQIPTSFQTDAGVAIPIANVLQILGTNGITTSGAGNVVTISGSTRLPLSFPTNAGTAIPAANILNEPGNNTANNGFATWTTGSGNTLQINSYGTAKWVVNPIAGVGTHQTIAAALTSASSGDTIFITPGTYTEDLTLKTGVNLTAFSCDGDVPSINTVTNNVTIIGKCSASFQGSASYSGISFSTNGDYAIEITGSNTTSLFFNSCSFIAIDFSVVHRTANSGRTWFYNCVGETRTIGVTYFVLTGGDNKVYNSVFSNDGGSVTPINVSSSAGFLAIGSIFSIDFISSSLQTSTFLNSLMQNLSSSLSGIYQINSCIFNTFSCTGSGGAVITNSLLNSTSNISINIATGCTVNCVNSSINSLNTNPISGAGTFKSSNLSFIGSGNNVNVTTQVPFISYNDAIEVIRPSSYPYTVTSQDALISVDTSGAASTVTLPASPAQGQKHTVKDRSANAAASNITVSGNGHNIIGTTSAATQVISLNGAAVSYVFDQTLWLAF